MDNNIKFNETDSLKRVGQEIGQPIIVPKGIRYVSEWKEYDQNYLFPYPHIVDKKIPGCGYTEYCIRNSRDIILCSPRRILLQNKFDQHPDEVFYAKNELEIALNVDKDLNSISRQMVNTKKVMAEVNRVNTEEDKNKNIEKYKELYNSLLEYRDRMRSHGKPMKILVTYDSYGIIKSILGPGANGLTGFGIFDNFYTVVDEMQSIFLDSVFKSTTEMKFMADLQGVQKVCYVSATPMIGSYLKMVPEFANLPYYYFDWETDQPERISKPKLKVRTISSLTSTIRKIINAYKSGKGECRVLGNKMVTSREAVIYLNSVNNICNVISKLDLSPGEVNILCADTRENRQRLKSKLGSGWEIGRVPLRGEERKMFTFCTRTVYLGADFYSDNAKTYVISDANISCMSVDISLDLPQILGRQRLTENPWKNEAEFYYIIRNENKGKSAEEIKKNIDDKISRTEFLLADYNDTPDKRALPDKAKTLDIMARAFNYVLDYISVNKVYNSTTGTYDLVPVENKLAYVADIRTYDIQYKDYADRFSVFNTIERVMGDRVISNRVKDFLKVYEEQSGFIDKAKFLCISDTLFTDGELDIILDQIDGFLADCYRSLGKEKIVGYGYNASRLKKLLSVEVFDIEDLRLEILSKFSIGDKISKICIKDTLREVYNKFSYNRSPKASDLEEWFEIKLTKVKNPITQKWENGFEILSLKP